MKFRILSFTLLILLLGCNSSENVVENFYDALTNTEGQKVKSYVAESVQIIWDGQVVCRNREELYKGFQYDSILNTRYKILEIRSEDSLVGVTLSKSNTRLQFLQDTAIVYKARIKLNKNRIAEFEIYDHLLLDLKKLHERQDSLVSWINNNHPELSGFELGESIKSAQDFLKAIELYKNRN